MKNLFFLFVLLVSTGAHSQEIYSWEDGVCHKQGIINSKLATAEQLDNIQSLLINPNTFGRPFLLNQPKDTAKIQLRLVELECANYIKEIVTADFPKGVFWDSIVEVRKTAMARECELRKLAIISIKNPDTLSSDSMKCSECKHWIKIIQSDDKSKIKAYKKWLANDGSTSSAQRFEELSNSGLSEKELAMLATIDFMRFEWWNCVSKSITDISSYTELENQFELLLTNVKTDCP